MPSIPTDSATRTHVRLGSLLDDSSEGVRFIQQRLSFFGLVMFLVSAGFLVAVGGFVLRAADYPPGRWLSDSATIAHLACALVMLCEWLVARRRQLLSGQALAALDAGAMFAAGVTIAVMGWRMTADWQLPAAYATVTATFGAALGVLTRAVIVPSTARRTAWTTALALSPALVLAWHLRAQAYGAAFGPGAEVFLPVEMAVWGVATTVLATIASRVIYGLHEKVQQARQLGQYTLEHRIGEGGMGQVYRARHALLRRPTAIKLLSGAQPSETQLKRFEQEVQLTSELTHPNTISVYDYGHTPEGVFYYAMEYLDGLALDVLVREDGPQSAGRVIHILQQTCGALAEAHEVGLIHRDIKPANIILCWRGGEPDVVKVLDFGLAKELSPSEDLGLSRANQICGSPLYMPPEAIKPSAGLDGRADLYSLGAVGYYLLTGHHVFDGESLVEVCSHHLHTTPVPPSKHLKEPVAPDLERVLLDCLAKKPKDRPADARTLRQLLADCADAGSWSDRQARSWWKHHAPQREPAAAPDDDEPVETRKTIQVDMGKRLAALE